MNLILLAATYIATAFFGPNAFPVPDPLDGRVQESLSIEAAADGYFSASRGRTADVFLRARVPLYTRYANLTVWMPVQEWYSWPVAGRGAGDVYVSTDIQLFSGRFSRFQGTALEKKLPDIALRAAVKTASGGQSERFRHFDDPGYWFDLSAGYSFYVHDWELRLSGTMGFLCWQTTTYRQNDAYYYGLGAEARHPYVGLRVGWQGYTGWETGDKPMTISATLRGYAPVGKEHRQSLQPYVCYQYGLRDYPFHLVRVGIAYDIDILNLKKK